MACTEVFTASSDGFIGHFNVKKSLLIGKIRCGEGTKTDPVHSVAVHPSDRSLLTGSVARITWWDLDTRSPLKMFSGAHLGPIAILTLVPLSSELCYLVSGGSSEQDHTLAVWNLKLDKSPIAQKSDEAVVARYKNENELILFIPDSLRLQLQIYDRGINRKIYHFFLTLIAYNVDN